MYWNEHQIRSAEIKILKPHSPEWQTVRAKLLAAGKRETVAFMDYQARQGKGWNVRGSQPEEQACREASKITSASDSRDLATEKRQIASLLYDCASETVPMSAEASEKRVVSRCGLPEHAYSRR